jgi:hypothetical protein
MLCNKNSYKNEFFDELLNNSVIDIASINSYGNKSVNDVELELEKTRTKISSYIMSITPQERKKKFIELEQFLISCRHLNEVCDSKNFTWNFHFTYGNCFVLYSALDSNGEWQPPKISNKENHYNGLKMELYTGEPNKFEALSSSSGFQLFVLNRSDTYSKFTFMDLSPGFEYNLMLDRTFLEQKPKPYSNCEYSKEKTDSFDSGYIKTLKSLNLTYSRINCKNLCYQDLLFKKCKCIDFTIDARLESKFCISPEEISCANDFFFNEYSTLGFTQANCDPFCPIECEKSKISSVLSFSKYPTESYFELLSQNENVRQKVFKNSSSKYVKESILKLNIYYESLSYTLITEEAKMTIVDLLSNIGGDTF